MLKTILLIFSGNAVGSLLLLARNLLIARAISIEDYGIAATFAISMAIVEMASGLGLQQMIVQDKSGNDPKLQAGVQGFHLLRSVLSAVVLFLLAAPIASFLRIPELTWAYQVLAIVPLMRGFEHFDIHRLNRTMTFGPLMISKVVPPVLAVLSLWPLLIIFDDYRVMLYSILIQWSAKIAISHMVARRRYALTLTRDISLKSLNFGLPLLLNNILLFFIFQGDKLLVGRYLSLEALGIFTMGFTLTLTPTMVLATSLQQFFLPQLSTHERGSPEFLWLAKVTIQASMLCGVMVVVFFALFGMPLVDLLLGDKFSGLAIILLWLAVMQAIRTFKVGNTIVALSKAKTGNATIANLVRVMALPVTVLLAVSGANLVTIVWAAIVGEIAAFVVSGWLMERTTGVPLRGAIKAVALPLAFSLGCGMVLSGAGLLRGPSAWAFVGVGLLVALIPLKALGLYMVNRVGQAEGNAQG